MLDAYDTSGSAWHFVWSYASGIHCMNINTRTKRGVSDEHRILKRKEFSALLYKLRSLEESFSKQKEFSKQGLPEHTALNPIIGTTCEVVESL